MPKSNTSRPRIRPRPSAQYSDLSHQVVFGYIQFAIPNHPAIPATPNRIPADIPRPVQDG